MIRRPPRSPLFPSPTLFRSLLDGRAYPSIEDLDPATLDDFGPHSVLLDFTAGSEDPGVPFVGRALRQACDLQASVRRISDVDRKSTRLNSSHANISYAVFCL